MLYEANYSSDLTTLPDSPSDSKIESNNKKDLKFKKSNSKLESILNSIQKDTVEYDGQYDSMPAKQIDYLSATSSCSSFSASSSPFITSQQSLLPNFDEIPIQQRNEYLNSSCTSYNGFIIDSSVSEQKFQFNYHYNHQQNSLNSPNILLQESTSSDFQYNDNQMRYYSNDLNLQQQAGQNFTSLAPIISTLPSNMFPSYSQSTVDISPVSEQQNFYSNQIIDNYNQNYCLLNQNNSNFYTNEQSNQPLTSYYTNQQVNHHLSQQLCYSNETNSLVFNMPSNNSLEDLESSSLTDSDDDSSSVSDEDLDLTYKMEINNFVMNQQSQHMSDQHEIEKNENRKVSKSNSNKKTYQKKKPKSDSKQQHLIISSSSTNSNMMIGLSNLTTNTNKRKRKRILNRLQRAEATMREKRRMLKLNKAFEELRKVLPISEFAKNKLSRAETLKSAIEYIEKMSEILSI